MKYQFFFSQLIKMAKNLTPTTNVNNLKTTTKNLNKMRVVTFLPMTFIGNGNNEESDNFDHVFLFHEISIMTYDDNEYESGKKRE